MMSNLKLTKSEVALLRKLAVEDQAKLPRFGSSAHMLRCAGYADWDDQAGGGKWWLRITPEGRAALEQD